MPRVGISGKEIALTFVASPRIPAQDHLGISPEDHASAILNMLEDFAAEKLGLEKTQNAVFNILEDSAAEKLRLESTQTAVINILEDLSGKNESQEQLQTAMLNLLEDFDAERSRAQAVTAELSKSFDCRAPGKRGRRIIESRTRSLYLYRFP